MVYHKFSDFDHFATYNFRGIGTKSCWIEYNSIFACMYVIFANFSKSCIYRKLHARENFMLYSMSEQESTNIQT